MPHSAPGGVGSRPRVNCAAHSTPFRVPIFTVASWTASWTPVTGLTGLGHPEVVVTGLPIDHAHTFLDHIGADVRGGDAQPLLGPVPAA
jgi:hypothetical protein